jgi:hypothetical protein
MDLPTASSQLHVRINSPFIAIVYHDTTLLVIGDVAIAAIRGNRQVMLAQICVEGRCVAFSELMITVGEIRIALLEIAEPAKAASGFNLEGDDNVHRSDAAILIKGIVLLSEIARPE